jgi:hypothetical protein
MDRFSQNLSHLANHNHNKAIDISLAGTSIASSNIHIYRYTSIMTYPTYSRQQLHCLSLVELKAIAIKIGAEVVDKRSKASHITAIVDHFEIITTAELEPSTQIVELTHEQLCLSTTGTRTLHELKEWCAIHYVRQTEQFELLYLNILNCIAKFPYDTATQLDLTPGCIDRTIQENAHLAEAICTELGITLMDLSLEYGDIVIPHGQDAYWVMVGANKIAALSTWGSGFVSSQSKMGGCDDPYTATLEVLEWMIGAGDIAIARAAVERDMEIKALMPEHM